MLKEVELIIYKGFAYRKYDKKTLMYVLFTNQIKQEDNKKNNYDIVDQVHIPSPPKC